MQNTIRGRVWKFGDNIDTDVISPSKYMDVPMDEMKKHAFEAINPRFPQEVKNGDVIIAGNNFGCGSSRETAPNVIKTLDVTAVVAESFGRIFFRNAIAIGLPIITCPGVSGSFEEGDEAELDIPGAIVKNISSGLTLSGEVLTKDILDILTAGGILALLKSQKD